MTREEAINHLGTYRFRGINHTTAEFIPAPDVWQEAMAMAIAALREQPQWISVEKRLPEPFVSVLVYMPGERPLPTVHEGYIATDGKWYAHFFSRDPGEVTHWMPLPEPPEVEV